MNPTSIPPAPEKSESPDVDVVFIELVPFVRSILALCPEIYFSAFLEKLQYYAINARVKDGVFEHIERVFQSIEAPQQ
jgi:hypothetical protein